MTPGADPAPEPAPLLLVLDLDETLIHATSTPLDRPPDAHVAPYAVYYRPHLQAFVATILARYRVAVWTTAGQGFAEGVLPHIFPPGALAFAWYHERCTRRYDPESGDTYYLKDLAKVRRQGYDLARVLVVDDSPEKHRRNYGNLVAVRPFLGDPHDDELPLLLTYLATIDTQPNVRSIEKRGRRCRA